MGVFENFPYVNFHEMNLQWLLEKMKELDKAMETFKATESLKFADPIIWDITTQYEKSTIVLDPTGNAYLSLQAVPTGIQLNNDEYWLEIFNFTDYTRTANQNLTINTETNTTRATAAYQVDDWLIWNDVLYRVTAAIAIDDALIVAPATGSNIVHFTVEDFIKAFITYATGLINQYKNDIDASELAYKNQVQTYTEQIVSNLQAQLNAAIAGATVDSEVINARIGWDNYTYSTLGEAIRGQAGALNHAINNNLLNLWKYSDYLRNGYINANGNFQSSSDWWCLDKVPVNGDKIYLTGKYGRLTVTGLYTVNCYDANGAFLGGVFQNTQDTHAIDQIVTLAANTKYVSVVTKTGQLSSSVLYIPGISSYKKQFGIEALETYKNTISDPSLKVLNSEINIFNFNEYIRNGYIDSSGSFQSADSWRTLYMLPVEDSDSLICSGTYGRITLSGVYTVTCFDASGNYLGGAFQNTSNDPIYKIVSLLSGTKFICVGTTSDRLATSILTIGNSDILFNALKNRNMYYDNTAFSAFLKFGVVGDSLSAGMTESGDWRNIDYSWGKILARRNGNKCEVFAKTGVTTKTWFSDADCYNKLVATGNRCQAYVVAIGTNDVIDSDFPIGDPSTDIDLQNPSNNADTFCGWYGKIIQTIITTNATARILVCTIPYPRVDSSKNTAIKAIAALFNTVTVVDLAGKYNYLFKHNIIHGFMIAGHYSASGYANLSNVFMFAISDTMLENHTAFDNLDDIPFDE